MRKAQKKQAEDFISLLEQAHKEIKKYMETGNNYAAMGLLAQCQEGAVQLGNLIEATEGKDCPTISMLEDYCELVYQIHEELAGGQGIDANNVHRKLYKQLILVKNSIRNAVKMRYEMVFLPYKASMWDALESVWQAADADPACDAYVIPIPYYDRNPDGTLGTYHYEGNSLPAYVPIVDYSKYSFQDRKPDAVFIHTPYDYANYVTTIDPKFYSSELKKHTECLVYILYYVTYGGMAEGQEWCPAYDNADYIIIQAEKYRKFFAPSLPGEKFVPLGSPKFDRVIHMCENPPEPPQSWKEKMAGRKVYFYNTSIQGMLGNTEAFLKKMDYVFQCFRGREDACLLWRPHPLLESTFNSMRPQYKPFYDALKREFIFENTGIYDDTSDIERSIAYSDAYIGDAATSVTALFGIVGKPLFILNNYINSLPEKDDWRGEKINLFFHEWGDDAYQVSVNNQLWFSEKNDYHYKFYMDLVPGYSGDRYYMGAAEIKGRIYVFPANAQNMLIIENKKARKIELKELVAYPGAFYSFWYTDKYIFLFPCLYPYLVRFNIDTEEVTYVEGINPFQVRMVNGERRIGGLGLYGNELVFASPTDNSFLFLDIDTLKVRRLSSNSKCNLGTQGIITEEDNLWLMPLNGMTITCWNPKTGAVREYSDIPQGFKCVKWPYECECEERPFSMMAFSRDSGKDNIVVSPSWGNMYVSLDRETGRMTEWDPPLQFECRGKNGYFAADGMGAFVVTGFQRGKGDCRIWYAPERKLYEVNIDTKECREIAIEFDFEELREHEPGFMEVSEWMQYCLNENAFNSLKDFLDGNITGEPFDRERQIQAFSRINADTRGTCGQNVYDFVKGRL